MVLFRGIFYAGLHNVRNCISKRPTFVFFFGLKTKIRPASNFIIHKSHKPFLRLLWLYGVIPFSYDSLGVKIGGVGVGDDAPTSSIPHREVIAAADELYTRNEVDMLYTYLHKFRNCNEAEVLWRLARASCDKAKITSNKDARKQLVYEAFAYAETALRLGEDNFACHKWYAIMLDYIGEYQGTKERLLKALDIKNHFVRAIELNDKDATSVHLLGYWCFVFADLSWYQQKLASLIFASPPTSSYQEALKYFLKAEEIEEGFYSMNLLMIGKTYRRMKEFELAKKYLLKTTVYTAKTEDDKKAISEAKELLKSL